MRYIEVVTSARVERSVESYETTLELTTSANKRVACFDEALSLRNAVLGELRKCGLSDSEIREAGGEASQSSWGSSKSVTHRIVIRTARMENLMSAMAAVERLFSGMRQSLLARIKQNFTFRTPVPIYAAHASADDALREAIHSARRIAAVIAEESQSRIGEMQSAVEETFVRRSTDGNVPADETWEDLDSDFMRAAVLPSDVSFAALPARESNTIRRFRVRFSLENATRVEDLPT